MTNNLPQGWVECEFESVIDVRDGTHDSPKYQEIGYPLVTSKCLKNGNIDLSIASLISENDYHKINERSKVSIGDVLFAMIGTIGNPVLIQDEPLFAIKNVALFKKSNAVIPEFLKNYLESNNVLNIMQLQSKGSTQKFVGLGYLRKFNFLLPPLNEQKRIVEKIEEEFEKIDEGIEKLKLVQEQIKQYKQSVLKSAFEGKLYKTTEWEETTLENVSIKITDGSHFSPKTIENGGYPYVTVKNVNDDEIDFENCKYISQKDYDELVKNGCKPLLNDVLFSKDGTVGKVTLIDYEREFVILSSLAIIRPDVEKILPQYLKWALKNPRFLQEATNKKTGVAIRRIILATLRKLQVRYPKPIAVQQKIVEEIEKRFEVADNMAKIVEENLEKAEQLKQSILKKAFEGRLVPQDLTDEPASLLLERIKKERNKK